MIQLRSGTQAARLTGASSCICKQQPETLGGSPTVVNQMERSPFTRFKLEPLRKSSLSLLKHVSAPRELQFAAEWEPFGYREMSTVPAVIGLSYLHLPLLLEGRTCSFCRAVHTLVLLSQRSKWRGWALFSAKRIGPSIWCPTILQCYNEVCVFKDKKDHMWESNSIRLIHLKSPVTLQKLLAEVLGQNK